ncbi:MAG: radical SAM protein [Candidatus Korarchaeota archaeon]
MIQSYLKLLGLLYILWDVAVSSFSEILMGSIKFTRYRRSQQLCMKCGVCVSIVKCPGDTDCIGCSSCYLACPFEAIIPEEVELVSREIPIWINDEKVFVPEGITLKIALELLGYEFVKFPLDAGPRKIYAPCETGGCYSCAVLVDGILTPLCHTAVRENMKINLDVSNVEPLRIVESFIPHTVGGVGTPWWIKGKGYIEVACFAAGCNLRCRTCQNFTITYRSLGKPMTPQEAAELLTKTRRRYGVDRLAISGGEPTLNRAWLVRFFKELKRLNPDTKARLHLDTNTTLLTRDYIDELVNAGVTDIGPDLKAYTLETFKKITNITDDTYARKYLETSWDAVKYMVDNYYPDTLFVGIGIPYNREFYKDLEELAKFGEAIARINPELQVCVLDYRAEFRAQTLRRPTIEEMLTIKKLLNDVGLKTVIVQTYLGHFGP